MRGLVGCNKNAQATNPPSNKNAAQLAGNSAQNSPTTNARDQIGRGCNNAPKSNESSVGTATANRDKGS